MAHLKNSKRIGKYIFAIGLALLVLGIFGILSNSQNFLFFIAFFAGIILTSIGLSLWSDSFQTPITG